MKWTKAIAVCVVAAVTIGAVATALAENAMPVLNWGECVVSKAGDYGTGCKKEGGAQFKGHEDQTITKNYAKKSKSGVVRIRVPALKTLLECASSTDTGEVTPPNKEAKIVIKFIKCKREGRPCTTAGAKKEELVSKPLKGELGWISKVNKEVGLDLQPEAGTVLLEADCEGFNVKVEGSVIGRITPVDVFTHLFTITFVTKNEKQEPESFQGGPPDTLTVRVGTSGPFPATLEMVETQTFASALYIETDTEA